MMNQRYRVEVRFGNIAVVDTKLFRMDAPNGVIVLWVGCGDNAAKLSANLQRIVAEYSVAPQNVKYI